MLEIYHTNGTVTRVPEAKYVKIYYPYWDCKSLLRVRYTERDENRKTTSNKLIHWNYEKGVRYTTKNKSIHYEFNKAKNAFELKHAI